MPLLTCRISVGIVAIGAARIYRGLVDHAASSHHDAPESFECRDEQQPETGEVKDGDVV